MGHFPVESCNKKGSIGCKWVKPFYTGYCCINILMQMQTGWSQNQVPQKTSVAKIRFHICGTCLGSSPFIQNYTFLKKLCQKLTFYKMLQTNSQATILYPSIQRANKIPTSNCLLIRFTLSIHVSFCILDNNHTLLTKMKYHRLLC